MSNLFMIDLVEAILMNIQKNNLKKIKLNQILSSLYEINPALYIKVNASKVKDRIRTTFPYYKNRHKNTKRFKVRTKYCYDILDKNNLTIRQFINNDKQGD